MLSLVLGSSTHAFELMLSAFILGLAFGGLWIRRRIDSLARPLATLAILFAVMAIAGALHAARSTATPSISSAPPCAACRGPTPATATSTC